MPIEVKKQEKESVPSLIRRFSRAIKQSGILKEARKKRFFQKKFSNRAKKEAALRRERLKKEYEKLNKLGFTRK